MELVEDRKENLHQVTNTHCQINLMQRRWECFLDKCQAQAWGEKFEGGKLSKERLSVLFCYSATGKKLQPLVISNAARPHVFQ
jgi:hypothetical protein